MLSHDTSYRAGPNCTLYYYLLISNSSHHVQTLGKEKPSIRTCLVVDGSKIDGHIGNVFLDVTSCLVQLMLSAWTSLQASLHFAPRLRHTVSCAIQPHLSWSCACTPRLSNVFSRIWPVTTLTVLWALSKWLSVQQDCRRTAIHLLQVQSTAILTSYFTD